MIRLAKIVFLIVFMTTLSGCSLDRTWFSMNSNSPMPFFGFDLRFPPKKTTRLDIDESSQHLVNAERQDCKRRVKNLESVSTKEVLTFPKLGDRKNSEQKLTFTGPQPPFSR